MELPGDVWEEVLGVFADLMDAAALLRLVGHLALVNKHWETVAWDHLSNCDGAQSLTESSFNLILKKLVDRPSADRKVRKLYLNLRNSLYHPEVILQTLQSFKSLRALTITECCLDHSHLDLIARLTGLTHLSIVEPSLRVLGTNAPLGVLTQLVQLTSLALRSWDSPPKLDQLQSLVWQSQLRSLDLANTDDLDTAAAPCIAFFTNLTKLNLCGTSIENGGVDVMLRKVSTIQHLDLSGTRITIHTLKLLTRLADLQELDISYCPISSTALPVLAKLTSLKKLHAIGCWHLNPQAAASLLPTGITLSTQPRHVSGGL